MDFSGLKDLKTTIPGVLVICAVTVAMLKGSCSFDQWWQVVLIILGFLGGGKLLFTNTKKEEGGLK